VRPSVLIAEVNLEARVKATGGVGRAVNRVLHRATGDDRISDIESVRILDGEFNCFSLLVVVVDCNDEALSVRLADGATSDILPVVVLDFEVRHAGLLN
jgi:hypothetical protein